MTYNAEIYQKRFKGSSACLRMPMKRTHDVRLRDEGKNSSGGRGGESKTRVGSGPLYVGTTSAATCFNM